MTLTPLNTDVSLSAAASPVLTCPNATQYTIIKATACNTDTVAHTISVYRVPNGGTAGATNALISALSIAAGATVTLMLSGHNLTAGQTLQALASLTSVVNLSISYASTP